MQESVLILCCTNRPNSNSKKITDLYAELASEYWNDVLVATLETLNGMPIAHDSYNPQFSDPRLEELQSKFDAAKNVVLVMPEYNGTFPGVFKYFVDVLSVKDKQKSFGDKNAAIIGVASGRAGNLRGLDQMTNALNYLGMNIYRFKLPISSIGKVLEGGELYESTVEVLKKHASGFQTFLTT